MNIQLEHPKYNSHNVINFQSQNGKHGQIINFKSKVKPINAVNTAEKDVFLYSAKKQKRSKLTAYRDKLYLKIYNRIKSKLNIFDADILKQNLNILKSISPQMANELEKEIFESKLNYDIMKPPLIENEDIIQHNYTDNYEDIKIGTNNRSDMQELYTSNLSYKNGLDYTLPTGDMKIKKADLKQIDAPFNIQSNISEKYSNSVVWNADKIARDLLQNFFDGHGQTLDGVRFIITPARKFANKKYKVRIEGKSIYNFKEAVLMGESSSHDNNKAAGNYGEGLKMITLKLLTQDKASGIKIGSGNWQTTCTLKDDARLDSRVMNYEIKPAENYDGNYIEFETSDENLLDAVIKSINRFYHSSNPHFKNPDFENDLFGIKILKDGQKGGLYISGQRFEYQDDFDNFDGILFIKEKIPADKYNMTRDRSSIDNKSIRKIAEWLGERTSPKELKQIIKCFEPYLESNNDIDAGMNTVHDKFLLKLKYLIDYKGAGAIKYPDNYASAPLFDLGHITYDLKNRGYKIFPYGYHEIGMQEAVNLAQQAKNHIPLKPTKKEEIKIILLKKALNSLSNLTINHFSAKELDTKIYIFDANSNEENSIRNYRNALEEAIIKNGETLGYWIDRTYLNNVSLGFALEDALHELSHKAGGDGSSDFSYKLTKVNNVALSQIINNPKIAAEMKILSDMWAKL